MSFWEKYDFWLMLISLVVAITAVIVAFASLNVTQTIRKRLSWLEKEAKEFKSIILSKNLLAFDSNDKCYYIPKKLLSESLNINLNTLKKFERLGFWHSGTVTYKPKESFNFFGRVANKHIIYLGTQEFKMDVYYLNGITVLEKLNIDPEQYLINTETIKFFGEFLIKENQNFHILIDEKNLLRY